MRKTNNKRFDASHAMAWRLSGAQDLEINSKIILTKAQCNILPKRSMHAKLQVDRTYISD